MDTTTKRVAIYLRVSKTDGTQTVSNQRPECEMMASLHGTVVKVYEEQGSAVGVRPAYDAMMADAKAGAFDVLVVWAIDRFGRSLLDNITNLTALDKMNIGVVSVRETWLNTTGPVRGLLIAIFSWVAEMERVSLIERTKAGLRRAKASGVVLGRPVREFDLGRAQALMDLGATQEEAAKLCGVSGSVLHRARKRAEAEARAKARAA